jgi:hypothetical protein
MVNGRMDRRGLDGQMVRKFDLLTLPPNVTIEFVAHSRIGEVKVSDLNEGLVVLLSHSGQI